jgi:hypothetical protein
VLTFASALAFPAHASLLGYDSCIGALSCTVATPAQIPNPIVQNPNNGILLGWNERQNVLLTADLKVNRVANPAASFVGGTAGNYVIKAGTIVSSHYFQWDPSSQSSGSVQARLRFDSEIFAFITSDRNLFDSDAALGLPGFDYADFGLRGLESGDTTNFAPGGDNRLVDIDWTAGSPGDWTRLITAFSPAAAIPEPTPLALIGAAILGWAIHRRRRAARTS